MHAPSAGLAQRCLQCARALSPALSPTVVDTLLSALMQCAAHPSASAFDFMTEVLITLRELLEASEPQQVQTSAFILLLTMSLASSAMDLCCVACMYGGTLVKSE